jgi:hypothetical protein
LSGPLQQDRSLLKSSNYKPGSTAGGLAGTIRVWCRKTHFFEEGTMIANVLVRSHTFSSLHSNSGNLHSLRHRIGDKLELRTNRGHRRAFRKGSRP